MDIDTTIDEFFGGRLIIRQPKQGYRAGVDPIILAASIPARSGESVLELGCGVGVASLCLARRVGALRVAGIEILPSIAQLARDNARENGLVMQVVVGDIANMPTELRNLQFDHVMANPPYFDRRRGSEAPSILKERSRGEQTPLAVWTQAAGRRVKPKGFVHFIFRTERLPELIQALPSSLGSIEVIPLVPRSQKLSELMILSARKSGKAGFKLFPEIVMHEGKSHQKDKSDYTSQLISVLRNGDALNNNETSV
jgi:tRNA1(Val) A37 N6-methylase TrmN6